MICYNLSVFILLSLCLYGFMCFQWFTESYSTCHQPFSFRIISSTIRDSQVRVIIIFILLLIILHHCVSIPKPVNSKKLFEFWYSFVLGTFLIALSFIFYYDILHMIFVSTGFALLLINVFLWKFKNKSFFFLKCFSLIFFFVFIFSYLFEININALDDDDCTIIGLIEFVFVSTVAILTFVSRIEYITKIEDIPDKNALPNRYCSRASSETVKEDNI